MSNITCRECGNWYYGCTCKRTFGSGEGVHDSLHDYDMNRLKSERSNLREARELLKNTEVPQYVHDIIQDQLNIVEFNLSFGLDPRLAE